MHRVDHGGTTFHFCWAACQARFTADPANHPAQAAALADPGATCTCPMHPQVRHAGPGECPFCGMALEPIAATAEAAPNGELADMTRRFRIGLVLALPVFALEMGGHVPWLGLGRLVAEQWSIRIQFALSTPVVLWAGWPFFRRAAASVRSGHLNMFTLVALGTGTAYLYSLVAAFAPGLFPPGSRRGDGTVAVYFEAAAVITVLVLLGQVLELRARVRTGGAVRALLDLAPKTARRLRDAGEDEEVALDEVRPGDRLRVRPGEGVPVDGTVLDGRSAVDETRAALDGLRADGIRVVMLTGDDRTTAEAVARQLGIEDVEADMLPGDKNRIVRTLRAFESRAVATAEGFGNPPRSTSQATSPSRIDCNSLARSTVVSG